MKSKFRKFVYQLTKPLQAIDSLQHELAETKARLAQQVTANESLELLLLHKNQERYNLILSILKRKLLLKKKIRVCFFVVTETSLAFKSLFLKLQKDPRFEAYIVVVPDLSRTDQYKKSNFTHTYEYMRSHFKNVKKGWLQDTNKYIDFSDEIDMAHFQMPYKGMTHEFFEVNHFLSKDVLTFHLSYSFSVTRFLRDKMSLESYNTFWRLFAESEGELSEFKQHQPLKGSNVVVTGYGKMDDLAHFKKRKRTRKRVILAPHHTIVDWDKLQISNFLQYADFFLQLPTLYPDIDFVFRPHPLLRLHLNKPEFWGKAKTNKYYAKMASYSNVEYQSGGEYFETFVNSDGMIHDCGSFLAEYMFTGNPTCYMLKDKSAIKKWFLPIGQECLAHCYQAYSEKDMLSYLDTVINENKDDLLQKRRVFVSKMLKLNYPHVSKVIFEYIVKEIKNAK